MQALKKQYKEVTGEDWGGAPQESSKKKKQQVRGVAVGVLVVGVLVVVEKACSRGWWRCWRSCLVVVL